jgi:hypothetical protein
MGQLSSNLETPVLFERRRQQRKGAYTTRPRDVQAGIGRFVGGQVRVFGLWRRTAPRIMDGEGLHFTKRRNSIRVRVTHSNSLQAHVERTTCLTWLQRYSFETMTLARFWIS